MKQYISPDEPALENEETIIYEGRMGKRMMIILGIVATFIPPFIWGPALIIMAVYFGKKAKLVLTDRRIIQVLPRFGGSKRITEIPIEKVIEVKVGRTSNSAPVSDFFTHLLGGTGDLTVTYAEGDRTEVLMFTDLKSPKEFKTKLVKLTTPKNMA